MTLQKAIDYAISDDVNWAFHRIMTGADRKAFDDILVASQHPLAYQPGTTEWRFKQYITERKQRT